MRKTGYNAFFIHKYRDFASYYYRKFVDVDVDNIMMINKANIYFRCSQAILNNNSLNNQSHSFMITFACFFPFLSYCAYKITTVKAEIKMMLPKVKYVVVRSRNLLTKFSKLFSDQALSFSCLLPRGPPQRSMDAWNVF